MSALHAFNKAWRRAAGMRWSSPTLEGARATQAALDAAAGDTVRAEQLLNPLQALQVRELAPAEAAAEWPDTVPLPLLDWMEGRAS